MVVERGHVYLGSTGSRRIACHLDDLLTDDLKAEIVEVFREGDFEWHELREFLTAKPPDTVSRLWPELVRQKPQAPPRRSLDHPDDKIPTQQER